MTDDDRRDLGGVLSELLIEIRAREEPILSDLGVSMWEYIVLTALDDGDAPTQAELARVTRRDKTRLIAHLDRLEDAGLVGRRPDPADRRNRIVELTATGRRTLTRCRRAIRTMEDELLGAVPGTRRARLRADLEAVADPLRPTRR